MSKVRQAEPPSELTIAGRYEVLGELGRGATGRVMRVRDRVDGAMRAMKVVSAPGRLQVELERARRIAHPNLARVFELLVLREAIAGWAAGSTLLVEEVAEGTSADRVELATTAARIELALRVGEEVARALSAIHAAGLVHGDVKPENVVVSDERVVLVDLGLARPPSRSGEVSGSLSTMAPEALLGEVSFASDVYSLGATMWRLLVGSPEDEVEQLSSDRIARKLRDPLPEGTLPEEVPKALRALLSSLLVHDAEARPSSAREVAQRIASVSESVLGKKTTRAIAPEETVEERIAALRVLPFAGPRERVTELASAIERDRFVAVVGPQGVGRGRLVAEAVRSIQLRRAQRGEAVPTYVVCERRLADRLPSPSIVHLQDAELDADELVRWSRAASLGESWLIVERTMPVPGTTSFEVRPLDRADLRALLTSAIGDATGVLDAAWHATSGRAGRLIASIGRAIAEGRDPRRTETWSELAFEDAAQVVPTALRPAVELVMAVGGEAPAELVGGHDASALESLGLASVDAMGVVRLRSPVVRAVSRDEARARAQGVSSSDPVTSAFLEMARGGDGAMIGVEMAARIAGGDPSSALSLAHRVALVTNSPAEDVRLAHADALRALARYREALAILEPLTSVRAHVLRAEIARLDGQPELARREAEAATGDRAIATAARIALDRGDREVARSLADRARPSTDDVAAIRALEVDVLLALAESRAKDARASVASMLRRARTTRSGALEARAHALAAHLALAEGDSRVAAERYSLAFEAADAAGELHAAASFMMNTGLARLELGDLGPSIVALREAARRLMRLGRDRDVARALYNLGNAALVAGDDELARPAIARGKEASERVVDESAAALCEILEAEIAVRDRDLDAARASMTRAMEREGAATRDRVYVAARAAVLLTAIGDRTAGDAALARARALASDDASDATRVELALAETRLALEDKARGALAHARAALEHARSFEQRLRAALLAAEAFEANGLRAEAQARLSDARAILDGAARSLDTASRARLLAVPSYARALGVAPTTALDERDPRRADALMRISRRLVAERRIRHLEEEILEGAMDLASAPRGLLLERDEDGAFHVRARRGEGRSSEARSFSRSIANRAIDEGRPVATVDAGSDELVRAAESVHALALRSVLAVPIRLGDSRRGVVYLDDRVRPSAFGAHEVELVATLADFGGVALDGAELLRAARRDARRLTRLERDLRDRVESQALEISALKRPEPEGDMVASSEPMRRVLSLVGRVSAASAPVLVVGESGTGKELVARMIHDRGPRAGQPFVSENCGAIPEPLLESALFGHVRGAFTGADRTRTGLFEAADGGTLFLDEIGEMSPGMQAKLLRVVQDGEVRAVGASQSKHVDVRIIAATHRDLELMVREGRFREDLFYRLAVVTIAVPPLRERSEDIPKLVAHFVQKYAPGRDVKIERQALARLGAYRFPGNVRQLENEVQRALILGGNAIREANLSPGLSDGAPVGMDDLDLKAQTAALERRLLTRALEAHGGNQTRAARQLGVSRFGLQKMIKRLGL